MDDYVDFRKLKCERDFTTWYFTIATDEERSLADIVFEYSYKYFSDFRFSPNSIVKPFIEAQVIDDDGVTLYNDYDSPPGELEFFDTIVLEAYLYKVKELGGGILGQVNYQEHSITIPPEFIKDKDAGKPHILHEIIHIYEEVINMQFIYYHDILLFSLYDDLRKRVPDLRDRIIAHTHLISSEKVLLSGGEHDLLFFLKSIDLDLSNRNLINATIIVANFDAI